jgi:hypothetical protein
MSYENTSTILNEATSEDMVTREPEPAPGIEIMTLEKLATLIKAKIRMVAP